MFTIRFRLVILMLLTTVMFFAGALGPAHAINFPVCYAAATGFQAGATDAGPPVTGFKAVKRAAGIDKCNGVPFAGSLYTIRRNGVNLFAMRPSGASYLRAPASSNGSLRWAASLTSETLPNVLILPEGGTTRMSPAEAVKLAQSLDAACGPTC